ncbi:probable peptide chain release factor C12orf65, mitochondrial [Penaeus monodon]|uniref:probable peptide chain release factor C12orf65, mitochondrial n=1 Tax=Penaeus monodon TaxID=6687 RepID=UPI0018A6E182|nr:probable peptide chain release factor C12orf65, mitochondrial [Penaeus monodon]
MKMRWLQLKSIYHHLQQLRPVNGINLMKLTALENRTRELSTHCPHPPLYLSCTPSNICPVLSFKSQHTLCRQLHTLSLQKQFSEYQVKGCMSIHSGTFTCNKKVDRSNVPTLNEEDLEESFIRGSGPGGQSVNKTASACMLKHTPTGIIVKCHEDRSLHKNRTTARKMMIEKLDQHFNGDMSVAAQLKRMQNEKQTKAQLKAKKKQMMKKA